MKILDLRHFKFGILIAISFILIPYGCNKTDEPDEQQEENKAPICSITNPDNGEEIQQGETVTISVDADDSDGNITEVRFYIDGSGVASSDSFPYNYEWNTTSVEIGSHTIKARAKDNEGESMEEEITIYLIEAEGSGQAPVAVFIADQTTVYTGVSIQFTDQSTNNPTSWLWDFGDEGTSTLQNPVYLYSVTGDYTVTLTITNSVGYDTETKANYITVLSSGGETGSVTDFDGNTYNTVKIGNQWWMAENLKTIHYTSGAEITLAVSNSTWANLGFEDNAYCYYDNSSSNANIYGALYTWAAAMNSSGSNSTNKVHVQGVCPDGWHLPTNDEWDELINLLGGENIAGGSMKEAGTLHWESPNIIENNESGFNALPGGFRYSEGGTFIALGYWALFWSATEIDSSTVWYRRLYNDNTLVHKLDTTKNTGVSVRCLKD